MLGVWDGFDGGVWDLEREPVLWRVLLFGCFVKVSEWIVAISDRGGRVSLWSLLLLMPYASRTAVTTWPMQGFDVLEALIVSTKRIRHLTPIFYQTWALLTNRSHRFLNRLPSAA